jgi:hypothetical protein
MKKKPLITFSEPYQTAPKKIQCIELEGAKRNVIIICVYMPECWYRFGLSLSLLLSVVVEYYV